MKIKLVFETWKKFEDGVYKDIYSTEEGIELSMGDFHSGTVFTGKIDVQDEEWLKEQIDNDYIPHFYITKD